MDETILVKISAQLDKVSAVIDYLKAALKESTSEPIAEEITTAIKALKKKQTKLKTQYKVAYDDMIELAEFLSSVEYYE